MQVKITNKSKHDLPKYETPGSSGMDIRANIEQTICLIPMQRTLVKTGLYLEMDPSIECQISILSRSTAVRLINGRIAIAKVNGRCGAGRGVGKVKSDGSTCCINI